MTVRGRKPKPSHLRVLQGNPGHRPIPKDEPRPSATRPSRPQWLLPEAKREWSRVVAELDNLGLLTIVDRATLAAYCQAYGRAVEAEKVLAKSQEGMSYTTNQGQKHPLPEIGIAERAWQLVRAFAAEFGFTPSSRTRLAIPRSEKEPDALEEWMRNGSRN